MTVAGASQYLNAARLANVRGTSPSIPSLLNTGTTTTSLLQAGKGALAVQGIGLSPSSRALTEQFLSRGADVSKLFSLGAGSDATVDGMKQQILALRARMTDSQLAPSLRGDTGDTVTPDPDRGNNVDTEA